MMLSLDVIDLGVPDVPAAQAFYTSAFSPAAQDHGQKVTLDLHGVAKIALSETKSLAAAAHTEPATSGFRGYLLSYIVDQPSEVQALLDAAARSGATVLKPAKKSLFAGFSAVYQAPDGAIWKLSAPTRKDSGPAAEPPVPTEIGALLGVTEPKDSETFYAALGMTVDRDYGSKYVDFSLTPGTSRLGLLPRKTLAKDAGVDDEGTGFRAAVFTRRAPSREEVDALLKAAATAGGTIAGEAQESEAEGYSGHFSDPDGYLWKVTFP